MMKILYFGSGGRHTTSRHRADALSRVGCEVEIQDPFAAFRSDLSHPVWGYLHFRTGYLGLQSRVMRWASEAIGKESAPDLIWVDSGDLFGPHVLSMLRSVGAPIVFFNVDDPTGHRDGRRFDQARRALRHYDLCVTVRPETEIEMSELGAKRVLRVWRAYDEVAHAPLAETPAQYRSEVAFVGTWMRHENRHQFLAKLIDTGINVSIWGERWQKAPNWRFLQPHWRGGALAGNDYVGAIQGTKICLGLLSKGNRDLHTTRSSEVPYAGGLLCAERTSEHLSMYREDEEAVFWSSPEECIDVCKRLLAEDTERERIRRNGMRRVRELKVGNEDVARQVLAEVAKL